MANFPGLKMTAAGRELQAKAQTGQPLKFTRVALGDGLPPADPDALVALVNECQTLSIQRQEVPGDGTAVLRVIMTNQGVATGFYMRELATFAEDPDTGAEVLYSYSNAGDECDFLPAEGAAVVWEGIFDLVTVVGNAENVTAVIDDYITIALKSEVDALKPRLMPAGGTVGQMVRKASNAEGDVEYFDPELDGFDVRLTSVEEPRTAVANQRVFTLQKTVTNGLAVYINGERLSRESWTALSATQLQLDDPLTAGTRVLFVNNEEAGPGRALNVSMTGPTLVYPASSNSFTITDFDSFSVYSAATTVGTVTRNGAALTLDIPAEAPEGTLDLEVTRDNVRATYRIAVGAAAIAAPEILAPLAGATNVTFEPDLAASAFVVYPAGYDSHAATHWQVARDIGFTDLVFDQQGADNLTAISLAAAGVRLDPATRYYVRAQYHGATLVSAWSAAVAFNTASTYVRRPRIVSPTDGQQNFSAQQLTADEFSVYGGGDTHLASRWQLSAVPDFSTVIVDSGWSAAALQAWAPSIQLDAGARYYVRVAYRGASVGDSEWSPTVWFDAATHLIGLYAGRAGGGTARIAHAAAELNGMLFICGGYDSARTGSARYLSDLWCYNPATNAWAQKASLPIGRAYGQLVNVDGRLFYYAGKGYAYPQDRPVAELYEYDPSADLWITRRAGWPVYEHAATAYQGKLYSFGGHDGSTNQGSMRVYDPATNVWETLNTSGLDARRGGTLVALDDRLFHFSGVTATNNTSPDLWELDVATGIWAKKASVPIAPYGTCSAEFNGRFYVFGGGVLTTDDVRSAAMYDPAVDAWSEFARLPSGRSQATAAAVDDAVYIYGGHVHGYVSNSLLRVR